METFRFADILLVADGAMGTLGALLPPPIPMPEVKDELMTSETEDQSNAADVIEAADDAVVETTETMQDEVSDGVAAVIPLTNADEEEEREPAAPLAEAA